MRLLILVFSLFVYDILSSQSLVNNYNLKIKAEAFNHFSSIVYKMNNEKGDREVYLSLFEDEYVKFIDDELSASNDNYSNGIKIGEFQEKVANRTITQISDNDWCGLPYYVGDPIFLSGDSFGKIDIVIKRVIGNSVDSSAILSDTQILVFHLNFYKKEFFDENYNVIIRFDFKIRGVDLHSAYVKPHYIGLMHRLSFTSFGKSILSDLEVIPDSVLLNQKFRIKSKKIINLKQENLLSVSELQITSHYNNGIFQKKYNLNFEKLYENVDFIYKYRIGEIGLKFYNNFTTTDKYMIKNAKFTDAIGSFRTNSTAVNFQFPMIGNALKNSTRLHDPQTSNLSYLVLDIGYSSTDAVINIQNHRESGTRIDFSKNTYRRVADYLSYKEFRKEQSAFVNFGYQKRLPINNKMYTYFSGLINASLLMQSDFSYASTVRYSGVYDDYFNIAISENGIMDYGTFSYKGFNVVESAPVVQIGSILDVGLGMKLKKVNLQFSLIGFFQPKSDNLAGETDNIGLDYGSFKHKLNGAGFYPRNFIGKQIRINIFL